MPHIELEFLFTKMALLFFVVKKKNCEISTKVGFVVSKKIHKRAVKRNRIKRLMRESIRLYIKENGNLNTEYMSLIFVASTKLLNKNYKEIDIGIKKLMSIITNA